MTVHLVTDIGVPISCAGMNDDDLIAFTQHDVDQLESQIARERPAAREAKIAKWIELLTKAGVTKGQAESGVFRAAYMAGPTVWCEPDGTKTLLLPPGYELWDGDDEWRLIEDELPQDKKLDD